MRILDGGALLRQGGQGKLMGRLMSDSCLIGRLGGKVLRGPLLGKVESGGESRTTDLAETTMKDREAPSDDHIHAQSRHQEGGAHIRDHRHHEGIDGENAHTLIHGLHHHEETDTETSHRGGSEVHLHITILMAAINGAG